MVSDVEEKQICCPFSAGDLKAALIHVLVILRVDQITVCFFKRIACGYEVTENHHSTRQREDHAHHRSREIRSRFRRGDRVRSQPSAGSGWRFRPPVRAG